MKDNKKFWNRTASMYDASRRSEKDAYNKMIDRIRSLLTPNMNVLELATATGIIALRVADCCKLIEATDFSEEMIKVANSKEKPSNVCFSVADATDLHYDDGQFDAVIISNALHIMPNPEKALANIRRVLKNDGLLIAPTYMRSKRFSEKIKVFIGTLIGFKTFSKWTEKEYLDFLAQNGWHVQSCEVFKATFPLAFVSAVKIKENAK
jgi:ubiquinone/menaquinone biosynthesis C-methylase UbiE